MDILKKFILSYNNSRYSLSFSRRKKINNLLYFLTVLQFFFYKFWFSLKFYKDYII